MHPDLFPFSVEDIEDGIKVRKITRMYWNGYESHLMTNVANTGNIELVDPATGATNECLTPEKFVYAVQYGGLRLLNEDGSYKAP